MYHRVYHSGAKKGKVEENGTGMTDLYWYSVALIFIEIFIFVYGGVHMEGKLQTQKHGFPENFAPKNIGNLHISYSKIWVKIVF